MSSEQLHMQYLQQQYKTAYPYNNVSGGLFTKFKRVIAPINPLAIEQASANNRLSFNTFNGNHGFIAPPLPNPVKYGGFLNAHYDPLTTSEHPPDSRTYHTAGPMQDKGVLTMVPTKFPRPCERYLGFYKRCVMVNGEDKCGKEERDFLGICPNFALEDYRKQKIFREKVRFIQRQEYLEAMEVPSYNKGRSVAMVDSTKRWKDGQAQNLRPDSIWADDRYADVTQEDIDAAKARVAARRAAHKAADPHPGYKAAHESHAHHSSSHSSHH